jgi:Predicted signal transduction protein with a C-terminal ATPase domain
MYIVWRNSMHKFFKLNIGKNFSPRLKTQLIASFVGMSFVILLITYIILYTSIVNIVKNQSEQENLKQIQQLEYNIDSFMNEVDKISGILLLSQDLQDYLDNKYSTDFEKVILLNHIYESLSNIMLNYDYIESIYYYGKNGKVIGVSPKRNEYLNDIDKTSFFYRSELYRKVMADEKKIQWYGGYSSRNFNIYSRDDENFKTGFYITAARSIKYYGETTAILVINVNGNFFSSIYNSKKVAKSTDIYIMDEKGRIVSHADESKINTASSIYKELNQGISSGSFVSKSSTSPEQVVFYRFDNINWTMVHEIPLSLLIKNTVKLRRIFIFMFIIGMAMVFGISVYWIYRITRPLNELTSAMSEMEKGKLGRTLPDTSRNELGVLGRQFNQMSGSILSLIEQIRILESEKREMEIKTLQAQINPHFLYNTLNTIKYMAVVIKANNIAESLTTLSNILRPIFGNPNILCTIQEEVEYAKNYIRILNYRYCEGIVVNLNMPDELMQCEILRFILQPLIENCFIHGVSSQNHKGLIGITAIQENNDINLIVEDNGKGMDVTKLIEVRAELNDGTTGKTAEKGSIGLSNVSRRIKLHYGDKYGIDVESRDGFGTKVVLRLPKIQKS